MPLFIGTMWECGL